MRVLLSSSITNRCAQAKDVAQSRTCQEKRAFRDSNGALQRAAELGRQRQASLSGTVKKLSWRERWRGYIRATETALFAALLVGALTAGGDMIISRPPFVCGTVGWYHRYHFRSKRVSCQERRPWNGSCYRISRYVGLYILSPSRSS
jgi:hypothetical protein